MSTLREHSSVLSVRNLSLQSGLPKSAAARSSALLFAWANIEKLMSDKCERPSCSNKYPRNHIRGPQGSHEYAHPDCILLCDTCIAFLALLGKDIVMLDNPTGTHISAVSNMSDESIEAIFS